MCIETELKLLAPLAADAPNLEAEVAWAARHELALSVDDVLARRTRLAQERPDRGEAFAPRVAGILGNEFDWSPQRQASETTAYLASAHREFDVPPAGQAAAVGQPAPEPA
jgi:glycerol-3-phosphate dehydrogenase